MKSIESSGKTVEDAVRAGLQQLGCDAADVTIDVLEAGRPGLFGMFGKLAKVRLTLKENDLDFEMPSLSLDSQKTRAPKPEKKAEPEKKPEKKEKEKSALPEGCVSADDFFKCQLRVAKVISCEHVKKSEKLLKFDLDLGSERRTILSGIAKFYESEQLIGKNLVIIANLPPRKMMGIESNGMILSAVEEKEDGSEYLRVLTVDGDVAPGSEVG